MTRIVLAILIGLVCCGLAVNSAAQTRRIDSAEVLKQLLAQPAPTPRNGSNPPPAVIELRPANFFTKENAPADDAPIEDLLLYWSRWRDSQRDPSPTTRQRLLEACISEPALLYIFLGLLPNADSTPAKVKDIYDKALADQKLDQSWFDRVRKWLVHNTTYYLDDLIALAQKTKDNLREGNVDKEDAISALARVSWTNAEPLLRGLMASGQPRSTALALSLFYKHAIDKKDSANEERYRRELQAVASNRNQPGYARHLAILSVSFSEWAGRDDWYLSLFQDETLLDNTEDSYANSSLTAMFSSDEKKWVPIITRLLESKDMNVRSAAANCLVGVSDTEIGKKGLLALLPWLMNPSWANETSSQRLSLIQKLGSIKVPESIPGLIWIVENDDGDPAHARGYAAVSLALYEDPRAAPALKRALAKEKDEAQRHSLIKGLLASHGLPEKEQLEALEEYAARLGSPESRLEMMRYRSPQEEPLPVTLTIGKYLGASRETPSESLINMVLARAEELRSQNPTLASALLEITHQWQGQQIELDIIRRISSGSADLKTIIEAIQRKEKMQGGLRTELQGLASVAGAAQAVGAVLLNDSVLAQGILTSEDRSAQIALLACSRLTQMPLPVEMIGPFLRNKDPLLTQAAETYLLAEDSREARELLWQRHPNEAFVTGWRERSMYGSSYEAIIKNEDKLRAELLKENGPIEIIALLPNLVDHGLVLRIYADKAVYTEYDDAARYRERTVPQGEIAALKDSLTVGNFFDRGPIVNYCHHGCPSSQLLRLTKEKGRRVFSQGEYTEWKQLKEQFSLLAAGDGAKVHYKFEADIKGLEVLYAGELTVHDVSQQGSELRVSVERTETQEERKERDATYASEDEGEEQLQRQLRLRRVELTKARFSWRVFAAEKLGAVTSAPDLYSIIDETRFISGDENDVDWDANYETHPQVVAQDSIIFAHNYDGLWRQFAGSKPVPLGSENATYSNPVVTRDGKWVIASKTSAGEDEPAHIVRLNLQTGSEFRVNLAPADQLRPVALLPALGKVVLQRAKDDSVAPYGKPKGPDMPEYFLLDPATGATRPVKGNFIPLHQKGNRFLQPTENPDEYWAAVPDEKKNHTEIGRYSLKDFSFKPVMVVPQIMFDSMSMWVEAGQKRVYLVYKRQLVSLPLQVAAK